MHSCRAALLWTQRRSVYDAWLANAILALSGLRLYSRQALMVHFGSALVMKRNG
jgi:hypothetical protein